MRRKKSKGATISRRVVTRSQNEFIRVALLRRTVPAVAVAAKPCTRNFSRFSPALAFAPHQAAARLADKRSGKLDMSAASPTSPGGGGSSLELYEYARARRPVRSAGLFRCSGHFAQAVLVSRPTRSSAENAAEFSSLLSLSLTHKHSPAALCATKTLLRPPDRGGGREEPVARAAPPLRRRRSRLACGRLRVRGAQASRPQAVAHRALRADCGASRGD